MFADKKGTRTHPKRKEERHSLAQESEPGAQKPRLWKQNVEPGTRFWANGMVVTFPDPDHPEKTPVLKKNARPQTKEEERHSKQVSRLWRAFVRPHITKPVNRDWMIAGMVPWLCKQMAPMSVHGLSMRYWTYFQKEWTATRDARLFHSRETRAKIFTHWKLIEDEMQKKHTKTWRTLRTDNQRRAFCILMGMPDQFFMSGMNLADRLALQNHIKGTRILNKFVALKIIERVGMGTSRAEAKAMGVKPSASTYRKLLCII